MKTAKQLFKIGDLELVSSLPCTASNKVIRRVLGDRAKIRSTNKQVEELR